MDFEKQCCVCNTHRGHYGHRDIKTLGVVMLLGAWYCNRCYIEAVNMLEALFKAEKLAYPFESDAASRRRSAIMRFRKMRGDQNPESSENYESGFIVADRRDHKLPL